MIYYTCMSENDTTYDFQRFPDGRGKITMTFTLEEVPDYGTDTMEYVGNGTEQELRDGLMDDMVECMEMQDEGRSGEMSERIRYYDNFSLNTLPAFAEMLDWLNEGESK